MADDDALRKTDIIIRHVWGVNPDTLDDDQWAVMGNDAHYLLGLYKDMVEHAVGSVVSKAMGSN